MPVLIGTPFGFSIDLSFWFDLMSLPTSEVIKVFYALGGWTILALVFFYMGAHFWVEIRTIKFTSKWKWVLLAVDIPPMFIQTPKAMEQIFAHLSGAKVGMKVKEKFWLGKKQKWFSFEIISIEGYIQFLIRTEAQYRDLVEAAVYAQYPEAEITEVEDYVEGLPVRLPNDDYEIYGLGFSLADNEAYPIRTYKFFEYNISKDMVFSDPMAALLENFTRIGKGEHLWFQILIEPTGSEWKKKGVALVKSLITGKAEKKKESLASLLGGLPKAIAKELIRIWYWDFTPEEMIDSSSGKVSDLSPGNKVVIEAIEDKISKIGFKSKINAVYIGRRDNFNPARSMGGLVGSLNQFHIQTSNGIVPYREYEDKPGYFKQLYLRLFWSAFRKRKIKVGGSPYVLNIEELATIWHFPLPFVKTPLVQKAGAKRGEPPTNLPMESFEKPLRLKNLDIPEAPAASSEPEVPEDLPYA